MKLVMAVLSAVLVSVFLIRPTAQQQGVSGPAGDWPMFRHDNAGTGFSPLADINSGNVSRLARAWTYQLGSDTRLTPPSATAPSAGRGRGGAAAAVNSEATPIVVGGVMYLPAANRVVALDSETGKEMRPGSCSRRAAA
jgi:quinoprotein glucose dehydrogenase